MLNVKVINFWRLLFLFLICILSSLTFIIFIFYINYYYFAVIYAYVICCSAIHYLGADSLVRKELFEK